MNEMISDPIGHQIDFNYEEEQLEMNKYGSNQSKISSKIEDHKSDTDVINQTDDNIDNYQIDSQVRNSQCQDQLIPTIYNNTDSDHESESQQSRIEQNLQHN